jgi:hypothetical protein
MRATEQTRACSRPKVRVMGSRSHQGPRGSVNSARFEALLDKLVAVQMDLEPVCGIGKHRTQVISPLITIAEACDTLRSAIADVRNIIGQADGLMDEPDAFADRPQRRLVY